VVAALVVFQMLPGKASSHQEAPLISQDPTADNTDLCAFVSQITPIPSQSSRASFLSSQRPGLLPAFDDSVLRNHVDNNGDARKTSYHPLQDRNKGDTFLCT
jgi:hypothetical protein